MTNLKKLLKNKKGQSMVEFALVFPLLVLILAVLIMCGYMINGQIVLNEASYIAARKAVVGNYSDGISLARSHVANNGMGLENVSIQSKISGSGQLKKGNNITITVTAEVDTIFGTITRNYPITGKTTMMVE